MPVTYQNLLQNFGDRRECYLVFLGRTKINLH